MAITSTKSYIIDRIELDMDLVKEANLQYFNRTRQVFSSIANSQTHKRMKKIVVQTKTLDFANAHPIQHHIVQSKQFKQKLNKREFQCGLL